MKISLLPPVKQFPIYFVINLSLALESIFSHFKIYFFRYFKIYCFARLLLVVYKTFLAFSFVIKKINISDKLAFKILININFINYYCELF